MGNIIEDTLDILKDEEGFSGTLYPDPGGKGRCVGYGRNLDLCPLTKQEGEYLLLLDVERRLDGLLAGIPFWRELSETAKTVLLCMSYQLGVRGVLNFKRMLAALEAQDYERAGEEILDSKWARNPLTFERAGRMAQYLREIPDEDPAGEVFIPDATGF